MLENRTKRKRKTSMTKRRIKILKNELLIVHIIVYLSIVEIIPD